jgi:hypothetical protein
MVPLMRERNRDSAIAGNKKARPLSAGPSSLGSYPSREERMAPVKHT